MVDTTIAEILRKAQRPLLSLEFFPPKKPAAFDRLREAIALMKIAHPDFTTVTYGAGGSTRAMTFEVCELLREMELGPVMPHLTCVGSSRAELIDLAEEIYAKGYRNVMALRGDPPAGSDEFVCAQDGFAHAADLVELLKSCHADFCVGVAGYPEVHPEAVSADQDIEYLRHKVNCGADFITTQLFFDNNHYYKFLKRCRAAGISQPIIPGLLPPVSLQQIKRIVNMCRSELPLKLESALESAEFDAEGIGIKWTVDQIEDLLQKKVPAIHLYILNRAQTLLAPNLSACLKRWHSF